jgi:hypothetical protein
MPFSSLIVPIDQLLRATARKPALDITIALLDLPGRHLDDLPRLDRLYALRSDLAHQREGAEHETSARRDALNQLDLGSTLVRSIERLGEAAADTRAARAAASFVEEFHADLLALPGVARPLLGALGARRLELGVSARDGDAAQAARERDLERGLDSLAGSVHGRVALVMSTAAHLIPSRLGGLGAAYAEYLLNEQLVLVARVLGDQLRLAVMEDDPRFEPWDDALWRARAHAEDAAREAWSDASVIREQRLPRLFDAIGGER